MHTPTTYDAEVFKIFEVQALLKVSRPTVNRMLRDGRLKKVKLGPGKTSAVRITRESVEALLHPTTDEG